MWLHYLKGQRAGKQGDPSGGPPGSGVHGAEGGTSSLAGGVNRKRRKCGRRQRKERPGLGAQGGALLSPVSPPGVVWKRGRPLSANHTASADANVPQQPSHENNTRIFQATKRSLKTAERMHYCFRESRRPSLNTASHIWSTFRHSAFGIEFSSGLR